MQRISEHHSLANHIRISNVWLLTDDQGNRFLIDTGHFLERHALLYHLWRAGIRKPGDLTAVLLTHRHSDHAGNAEFLRRKFKCPVVCHSNDAAILSGRRTRAKLARGQASLVQEALCHFEDNLPAKTKIDEHYSIGEWKFGFHVIPVPGHTEGSVMLYHEPTRTLFSGDAILAGPPPLRSVEKLMLALPGFSLDADQCHSHIHQFLGDLPAIEMLCAGHGPAVKKNTRDKLLQLSSHLKVMH